MAHTMTAIAPRARVRHTRSHRTLSVHTGFDRVIRRGLSSRGVPLPASQTHTRPGRIVHLSIRQRSWDFSALRSFPCSRVPALSAVHPHMPLSKSFRSADFYGCWSQIENSFQATRERPSCGIIRPATGSCAASKLSRRARASNRPILPWALFLLSGFRMLSNRTPNAQHS